MAKPTAVQTTRKQKRSRSSTGKTASARPSKRSKLMQDDNQYFVEAIHQERIDDDGKKEYLVEWEDEPIEEASWVPAEDVHVDLIARWGQANPSRDATDYDEDEIVVADPRNRHQSGKHSTDPVGQGSQGSDTQGKEESLNQEITSLPGTPIRESGHEDDTDYSNSIIGLTSTQYVVVREAILKPGPDTAQLTKEDKADAISDGNAPQAHDRKRDSNEIEIDTDNIKSKPRSNDEYLDAGMSSEASEQEDAFPHAGGNELEGDSIGNPDNTVQPAADPLLDQADYLENPVAAHAEWEFGKDLPLEPYSTPSVASGPPEIQLDGPLTEAKIEAVISVDLGLGNVHQWMQL